MPSRSTRIRILLAFAIVVPLAVAGSYYFRNRLPKRLATVEPGVLYRCGQPDGPQLRRVKDNLGIRTVLIVRKGDSKRVPDEKATAESLGLTVVHIPIESRVPVSDDEVRRFFDVVDDPANRPVLIHCSAGRHRTGYLCALYRIERQGWTLDAALDEMLSFGFDRDSQHVVEKQLRAYVPTKDRGTTRPAPTSQVSFGFGPMLIRPDRRSAISRCHVITQLGAAL